MLLSSRAYVVKKHGCVADAQYDGEGDESSEGQVTWSKFDGPAEAWKVAKARAKFI